MADVLKSLQRFMQRFTCPHSWIEDVAEDLGVNIPRSMSLEGLLGDLRDGAARPSNLFAFMPRKSAEQVFEKPIKKEFYKSSDLFSYYFNGGWLVVALHFDQFERLINIYVNCPAHCSSKAFEVKLEE